MSARNFERISDTFQIYGIYVETNEVCAGRISLGGFLAIVVMA